MEYKKSQSLSEQAADEILDMITIKKQFKVEVDKKKIDMKETIKTLGVHNVGVKLYEGVSGTIKVDVRG